MQQLIYFLKKYKYFLYFLLLQFIALIFIINSHSYHRSKFINSANAVTGGVFNTSSQITEYLNLKSQNKDLAEENSMLRNKLASFTQTNNVSIPIDTVEFIQKYEYKNGKIINNQYHSPYNFLTINKGKNNGVFPEMAVINSKGIIGITNNVSSRYATVQSILNKNSKINARFKNNTHFGTLIWNGEKYNTVQLSDIPRQAIFKVGDTIITGGKSTIFPEGIPIGKVAELPKNKTASNTINIELFNDMSNLGHIYIINNTHKKEIKELENLTNE